MEDMCAGHSRTHLDCVLVGYVLLKMNFFGGIFTPSNSPFSPCKTLIWKHLLSASPWPPIVFLSYIKGQRKLYNSNDSKVIGLYVSGL